MMERKLRLGVAGLGRAFMMMLPTLAGIRARGRRRRGPAPEAPRPVRR